jgi:hypothetical protein
MWYIYGNEYDLTPMIDTHPGGKNILNMTKNLKDITLLFETYHTFTNRDKLIEMLEKYRVNKNQNSLIYNYNNDNIMKVNHCHYGEVDYDFLLKMNKYENSNYNKILNIIKEKFPTRFHIKSSPQFILSHIGIIICYLFFFYFSMFSDNNIFIRMFYTIIAGLLWTIIVINVMHNSSHYALSHSANINYNITKIINNFSLWNNKLYYLNYVLSPIKSIEDKTIKFNLSKGNIITISSDQFIFSMTNYFNFSYNIIINIEYFTNYFTNSIKSLHYSNYDKYDLMIMASNYYCLYNGGFLNI